MKNPKTFTALMIVALTVVGAGMFYLARTHTDVRIPTLSCRPGDASTSAEFLNAQKAAAFYHDEIKKNPDNTKNYVQLAQLFLQEGRVTGLYEEYIPKARYLLDEALRRKPEDFEAAIIKASMLMTLHHFEEAKEVVEKAIAGNPYNAFAYGVLCDALVELGKYNEAVTACDRMLTIRPDLRSYARAAYLREIHGDPDGAREAMRLAADAGVFGHEDRAWVTYQLGMLYLNEGRLDTAEYVFKGILDERPNYAYAMSGLARVAGAHKNYSESARLFHKAFNAMPDHTFIEELAGVYRATGDTRKSEDAVQQALLEFKDQAREGWQVDGEFAIFSANHNVQLNEALARAKREYERRPDNIQALDTYAWVLFKNGKPAEAVPYIERALRLGTRNASLHYHAGMIYRGAGNVVKAKEHLQEALRINPYLAPPYTEGAEESLAALRDIAQR